MAEERIIDDEYGRGVKLRKTKDGYVDVTDELAEAPEEEGTEEEVSFAFPMEEEEEDDEDLVGLTPEEAIELRRRKAEAAERLRAEYDKEVAEGNALLETSSFHAAELKFEKALKLDTVATEASVGYWRAKTADFTNPDVLIEEYVDAGIESLEYDLGYEAAEIVKKQYRGVFQKRYDELKGEEEPLFEVVTRKQQARREVLKARKKKNTIAFAIVTAIFLLLAGATAYLIMKNFSTPNDSYMPVTIVISAFTAVGFFVFAAFSNKLLNTYRIFRTNEKLDSTEEGEKLSKIMEYKDLYAALLEDVVEEE